MAVSVMIMLGVLLLVSLIAGLLGGLTGTGGILIPPVMMTFMDVPPHLATGTAQASFIIPGLLAVWMFYRHGDFSWRIAVPMSLSCLPCAFAGANVKAYLNGEILTILLALFIFAAGALMLSPRRPVARHPLLPPYRAPALFVLGAIVGFLTGITGSGSNAILVPVMVYFHIDLLSILAACQFYASLAAIAGTAGNALHAAVDLGDALLLTFGLTVGIAAGVAIAQKTETSLLKRCVGIVCMATAVFLLVRASLRLLAA